MENNVKFKSRENKEIESERKVGRRAPVSARLMAAVSCTAALLACPSCKKDADGGSPSVGRVGFKAVAEAHTGDGKTQLVPGDGGTGQVIWSDGNTVAVFNSAGNYGRFIATNLADDDKTAELVEDNDGSGSGFSYTPPYRAVYPDDGSWDNDNSSITGLSLPGSQGYREGGFGEGANPMAAYSTGPASGSTTATLPFKNLCGLLRVSLKCTGAGAGGGWTVKSIRITSKGDSDALWGGYSVKFNDGGGSKEVAPTLEMAAASGRNTVTLDGCNAALTGDATDFYIVLPAGALAGGFTMEVIDSHDRVACRRGVTPTSGADVSIKASTITSMPVVDMLYGEDLAVGGKDGYETANCYVATEEGHRYMFPCNVRGNGAVPTGNCATYLGAYSSKDISGHRDAAVVWQTFNDGTTDPSGVVTDVKLEGDYVHFRTGSRKGNALIAIYDATGYGAEGHNGNILWSWHIWRIDGEPGTANSAIGGVMLMDRNLGALTANEANGYNAGFLYQWGRKDPLFGAADYMTGGNNFMNGALNKTMDVNATESTNLGNSIKNPTKFITNGGTPYDWFTTNNVTTGNGYCSNGLWDTQKTMFDPCPHGWRVAQDQAFGIDDDSSGIIIPNQGWTYCSEGASNFNSTRGLNFNTWYFPASGYRDFSSGELLNVGSNGYSWSCSPYSADLLYNAYSLNFNSSNVYPEINYYRAYGFPVRPVQE